MARKILAASVFCAVVMITTGAALGSSATVRVSPHAALHDGQTVRVSYAGFPPYEKVFFFQCISLRDLTDGGPGGCQADIQSAPFGIVDPKGAGHLDFVVHQSLAGGRCTNQCLIAVTNGNPGPMASTRVSFLTSTLPVTGPAMLSGVAEGAAALTVVGALTCWFSRSRSRTRAR